MKEYHDLLQRVLNFGERSDDRTGTGTFSLFGERMEFDLTKGFPLLTTKSTPFNLIKAELLWFLSGSTNNEDLRQFNGNDNPTIWEGWADAIGDLGPIYGKQWRYWNNNHDQIGDLIIGLKGKPKSRRHIVSAWNVVDLPDERLTPQQNVKDNGMALAPCHMMFQCYVDKDKGLHLQIYQRSCDSFLGLPFNIASYALLTHLLAAQTGLIAKRLIWLGGDTHIYRNHLDQVNELLRRDPEKYKLPTLMLSPGIESIDGYTMGDIVLDGYESYPKISAPISV
jgi:thymidylate synthase